MSLLREPGVGMGGGTRPRRQLFRRAPVDPTGADQGGRPAELGPPASAPGAPDVRLQNFRRMMMDMKSGGEGGVKMPPQVPPPTPMQDGGEGAVKPGFIGSGAAMPATPAPPPTGTGFDIMQAAPDGMGAQKPNDFNMTMDGGGGDVKQPPPAAQLPPPEIEDKRSIDEQSYF